MAKLYFGEPHRKPAEIAQLAFDTFGVKITKGGVQARLNRAGYKLRPRGAQNVGRFKLTDAQEEEIAQLYHDLSSIKIAPRFGISKPTVLEIVRRKGGTIRDDSVGELPWEELKTRYEDKEKVTLLGLAKEHGISYGTMRLRLDELKCKFRPKAPKGNTRHKEWWDKVQTKLGAAWRPDDWNEKPIEWRIVATELFAGAKGNLDLAERLFSGRLLDLSTYGAAPEEIAKSRGFELLANKVKNWIKRPS